MANEIWHTYEEGLTLYALIWRKTDDKVYDVVAGAFDTYTDADIDDYDLVLANAADSDYYSVDFPSGISAGVYRVQVWRQVGGSIDADDDTGVGQGEIYWDGSAEINLSIIDTIVDAILVDTGTTLPAQISALNNLSADDVHDEIVEGTVTFRQAMKLLLSVMTGKSSGGGTTTLTFRDIADTKDRLSVTVDQNGNRTAVGTRDGS